MLLKNLIGMVLAFIFKQWFIFHLSLFLSKAVPCKDMVLPNMISNCQFSFQVLVMDLNEKIESPLSFRLRGLYSRRNMRFLCQLGNPFSCRSIYQAIQPLLSLAQRNVKLLKLLGWSHYLSKSQFCPCREGQMINPVLFPLQLQVFPKDKSTVKQFRN